MGAGPAVQNFRPGDRVSVPFNVACGRRFGLELKEAIAGRFRVE